MNEYFEEINNINEINRFLMLVPANESKEKIKKHEDQRSGITDLIRLTIKNSFDGSYDEKL